MRSIRDERSSSGRATAAHGLVYSTDAGRMCPDCRQPLARCGCRQVVPVIAGDGFARVGCEKKGRGGKTVTVVRGLAMDPAALLVMARKLKTVCGSGGTVSDGTIEIQGDQVQRVVQTLQAHGCRVKRTGA